MSYLYYTLTPANLIWQGTQLTEYGRRQERQLKPYTREELVSRIELSELPGMYRGYLMKRLNNLVYRVSGDTIYIADFWDVHRDPQSLTAQVK